MQNFQLRIRTVFVGHRPRRSRSFPGRGNCLEQRQWYCCLGVDVLCWLRHSRDVPIQRHHEY